MTIDQEPVEKGPEESDEAPTEVVRATSRVVRPSQTTAQTPIAQPSAVTTAELPAVRGGAPVTGQTRSRYADPRPPGRARRRDPAPIGLRAAVWMLALVLLVAVLGLVTVQTHPTWLAFLRNAPAAPAAASTSGPSGASGTTGGSGSGTLRLVSTTASAITYSVPKGVYTLVVTVPGRCNIAIHSPANATTWYYDKTVSPAGGPTTISLSATSTVHFYAAVTSIDVRSGSKDLGKITTVSESAPYVFTFAS